MKEVDKIYNEDCLTGIKKIPDNSIDVVVTDVPYLCTPRGSSGNAGGMLATKQSMAGKIFEHNDVEIEDYLPELYRVLKPSTHCYIMCNHVNLTHFLKVIDESEFHFVKCLIWDKGNVIMGKYYMNSFEYILMLRKGADRAVNDCGIKDILSVPNIKTKDRNGNNIHDSEKPMQLMRILIEQSSNVGDVVLDPFMGSGTTAVAAKLSKRHYIGYEIDPKYAALCEKRINEEKQTELF